MRRQDFLALIPMLGAAPFIGKELIQEKNKIILLEPKPIEVVKEMPEADFNHHNFGLQLTYNGHVIAVADMTGHCNRHSYTIERGHIAEGYCDSLDHYHHLHRESELRISASFRDSEIWNAVHSINRVYE